MKAMWGKVTILALAFSLAAGCARRWKVDDSPAPALDRSGWMGWGVQAQPEDLPGPVDEIEPVIISLDEIERAILAFQARRRGNGPALDSAWPPFIETLDAYLDQAPERLSLSPLIRARVAAEYELDSERRRAAGTPPELERLVVRLVIRIDRKMRALRTLASTAARPAPERSADGLHWPVTRGVITSGFGNRRDPILPGKVRFHAGIDLSAPTSEPVYAAAAGVVVAAGWAGSAGRMVRLRHPDGLDTLYAHLSMVMVKIEQRVGAGDVIGLLGSSGRATGPHLHFAVYQKGKPVDPLEHLRPVPMSFSDLMPGIVFGWGE